MEMPAQVGDNAEGVRVAGRILTAARNARWPMYLRNVKQILRQTEGGFDERRYGFGGLMDLLKACQREGSRWITSHWPSPLPLSPRRGNVRDGVRHLDRTSRALCTNAL